MADTAGFVGSGQYAPTLTELRGSDFSGADGATNRTYAIAADSTVIIVFADGTSLIKTQQYTYDGATLTIIDALANDSYLNIITFNAGG